VRLSFFDFVVSVYCHRRAVSATTPAAVFCQTCYSHNDADSSSDHFLEVLDLVLVLKGDL